MKALFIYFNLCLSVISLDLQLPVQSVHITTNIVSSNPVHGEVYQIQHYVIKFVSDIFSATPVFSTNNHLFPE
jgi:hypothetical protein